MTEQEFISLSVRIRGKLIALARRFSRATGWQGESEDIVQDALVTLWQLAKEGYPIRNAEALAVKIMKTRCVERYRRQHLRDRSVAGGEPATLGTERMDLETIRGIVQKGLTDSQRQLLELRHEDGLSLDEIAALTGRPKASLKVSLSTARKRMMDRFKN